MPAESPTQTIPQRKDGKKRFKPQEDSTDDQEENQQNQSPQPHQQQHVSSIRKKTPPSQLIRTSGATPVGAIEPFLITQSKLSSKTSVDDNNKEVTIHKEDCPLSQSLTQTSFDLSQPGAFAQALSLQRCNCFPSNSSLLLPKKPPIRLKRVIPTTCHYDSISELRKRINKHRSPTLTKQLRDAYFVGVLSHQRSLIQCGEDLVMIHHQELARHLFYQLALAHFSGVKMAQLGGHIHVPSIIAQALEVEDQLVLLEEENDDESKSLLHSSEMLHVNPTNQKLARDAATCLLDHADMLEEYFGIRIEQQQYKHQNQQDGDDERLDDIFLTGLPILLEGHSPEPYGLPIFLLRLATQVDWAEELPCFEGICRELGMYYAMVPSETNQQSAYIRHTLFPAISFLLNPLQEMQGNGSFSVITRLSTLYKVFERC